MSMSESITSTTLTTPGGKPASAMSWHRYLGDAGRAVSIEHFGASADYQTLYEKFGITADAVVTAAEESISAAKGEA